MGVGKSGIVSCLEMVHPNTLAPLQRAHLDHPKTPAAKTDAHIAKCNAFEKAA